MKEAPNRPAKQVDSPFFSDRMLGGAAHLTSPLVRNIGVIRQSIRPVCVYHPPTKYGFWHLYMSLTALYLP
jgi:hypothetical protein